MDPERLEDLISDYLDGTLSPEEVEELTRELRSSPEARRRLLTAADQDLAVQELARSLDRSETPAPARRTPGVRHSLRRTKVERSGIGWKAALIAAGLLFAVAVVFSLSSPGPVRPKAAPKEAALREPEAEVPQEESLRRAEAARKDAESRLEALRREEERLEADRKKPAPAERDDLVRKAEEVFREIARKRKEEEERLSRLKEQEAAARRAVEKAAAPTPTASALASVERVEGEAWAVSPGKRTALAAGHVLLPEQGLDVGARGRLVLVYADETRLELGSGTKVRGLSDRPRKNGVGKWLEVLEGQVLAKVTRQPAGRAMAIATPHAEALVLGTTLRLVVESGSTRLEVEEGRVRLKRLADGKTVEVSGGHFAVAAVGVDFAARAVSLYSEDFDSGRLAGWTFPRAYPWTLERTPPRGFALTSPKYPLDQGVQERELVGVLAGKAWKDCTVEAQVRLEELPPSGSAGFTLYARYQDWSNLVRLEYLRSPQGQWTAGIDQGRPGVPGDVSTKPAPALEVGRAYRIRLELRGPQVSASVDGREVVRAPTLFDGPGTIALGAPGGRWSFDTIKVSASPPPPK